MAAGATYEPIATTTVSGSAASSIVFSSLGSYTDIKIVISGTASADYAQVGVRFNGDTASNYSMTRIYGTGSAAASQRNTSATYISGGYQGWGTTKIGLAIINVFSYAGSTNKTTLGEFSEDWGTEGAVSRVVGLWRSTSAITSITLISSGGGANFSIGTTATLYGIKAA